MRYVHSTDCGVEVDLQNHWSTDGNRIQGIDGQIDETKHERHTDKQNTD